MRVTILLIALLLTACGTETRTLSFDFEPLPYPLKPHLTFSGAMPGGGATNIPLSTALVDRGNQVWVLGDGLGLMVFDYPSWNGKKIDLPRPAIAPATVAPHPEQLAESPDGMMVTWPNVGQASLQQQSSWQVAPLPAAGVRLSRSGDWLLPTAGHHWQRRTQNGQTQTFAITEESATISADLDGSFAALSEAGLLECFDATGGSQLCIRLPQQHKNVALNYQGVQRLNGKVYVLYQTAAAKGTSYVLVLDLKGTVRHHWSFPISADLIDSNGQILLLLERQSSQLYVFPLEN